MQKRFCYTLTQQSFRLSKFQAQQILVIKFEIFSFLRGPDDALCGAKLSCSVSLIKKNAKPDQNFKFQNQNLKSCKKLAPCRLAQREAHLTVCFGSSAVEIT